MTHPQLNLLIVGSGSPTGIGLKLVKYSRVLKKIGVKIGPFDRATCPF